VGLVAIALMGLGAIIVGVMTLVIEPDLSHRTARGLPAWFGVLLLLTAGPCFLVAGIGGLRHKRR